MVVLLIQWQSNFNWEEIGILNAKIGVANFHEHSEKLVGHRYTFSIYI